MSFLKLQALKSEQVEILEAFRKNNYDYIIMTKSDDGAVLFGHSKPETKNVGTDLPSLKSQHQDMVDYISENFKEAPCYVLYNAKTVYNAMLKEKACIILWNPQDGPRKTKMTYASSFEDIKNLVKPYGSPKAFQCDAIDDLSYDDIIGSMLKN